MGRLSEPHDGIFEVERVAYLAKDKALGFRRSLHIEIAEVEHSRDDAFDRASDVLDASEAEFAYVAYEETFLLDVHDALVGDDPDIEIVIDPDEETMEPEEEEKGVLKEKEEAIAFSANHVRKEGCEKEEASHQADGQEGYEEHV